MAGEEKLGTWVSQNNNTGVGVMDCRVWVAAGDSLGRQIGGMQSHKNENALAMIGSFGRQIQNWVDWRTDQRSVDGTCFTLPLALSGK